MKTIVEYNITGDTKGMMRCYPKNNKKINFKDLVCNKLNGYKNFGKDHYNLWEKYDEFINMVKEDLKIDIDLNNLISNKNKYYNMKNNSSFYTENDFNEIITLINNEYENIIKDIENRTNKRFGKDYILL